MLDAPAQFSSRSNTDIVATSGQTSLKNADSNIRNAHTVIGVCLASEPPTERMAF